MGSLQSGVLATLTEVNITHPSTYTSNSNYTDQIKNGFGTDNAEKMNREVDRSSKEIEKLVNYSKIKKSPVFRVHPIKLQDITNKCDYIVNQPFNVFIYKKDLPILIKSIHFKELFIVTMQKVTPPHASKGESNEKSHMVVRVCIIDEYFNQFSKQLKPCFSEKNISRKFPILFVSDKLMSCFNLAVGVKVSLSNTFCNQVNISSMEIRCAIKKSKNIAEQFKTFITEQIKHEKCLLNANCCIEIEDNVFCSLIFNPESEFCLFDEQMAKTIKMYENIQTTIAYEKLHPKESIIHMEELFRTCDSFNRIINNVHKLLCLKNCNENIFIVGKCFYVLLLFLLLYLNN